MNTTRTIWGRRPLPMPGYTEKFEAEADTRALIEPVVGKHSYGHRIEVRNVQIEIDHEGEENLLLDLHFEYSKLPVDPGKTIDMRHAIGVALQENNDYRFPYIKYHFDDKQEIMRG